VPAAHPRTARLRIAQSETGREPIEELSGSTVGFPSAAGSRSLEDHSAPFPSRCSTVGARCGIIGAAMAAEAQAPDLALLERERVLLAIREHEAALRALGVSRLWATPVAGAMSTC
jgi:hypothetical protein